MISRVAADRAREGNLATQHWDEVYGSRPADQMSWFQRHATVSLELLEKYSPARSGLVDVGAGCSVLVDALAKSGWSDLTIADLSSVALTATADRLGSHARQVDVVVVDVLRWRPQRQFTAWHDRALFHFLVEPDDRASYVTTARICVAPGGILVVGAFAEGGPAGCSGLPTARYGSDQLASQFSAGFHALASLKEEHLTPAGSRQPFTWLVLRRDHEG